MSDLNLVTIFRATVIALVGFPLLLAASRWVGSRVGKRLSLQQGLIAQKLIFYPGVGMLVVSVLTELGFSLTPLLGAAGVVGIAVGFASQTSVSNVISGFFLIAERPFEVGDVIQVGDVIGNVLSIDTLSVKIRTFDNRFVRIPNETIVKSVVTTVTRFPIRRVDLNIGVGYGETVARVREILFEVVARNPMALVDPAPQLVFEGYGDSSLNLRLAVWAVRENFLALKTSLLEEIKAAFDAEGIEIPFPHRTIVGPSDGAPIPVTVVPGTSSSSGTPSHDEGNP